jgi:hypothetical protein
LLGPRASAERKESSSYKEEALVHRALLAATRGAFNLFVGSNIIWGGNLVSREPRGRDEAVNERAPIRNCSE